MLTLEGGGEIAGTSSTILPGPWLTWRLCLLAGPPNIAASSFHSSMPLLVPNIKRIGRHRGGRIGRHNPGKQRLKSQGCNSRISRLERDIPARCTHPLSGHKVRLWTLRPGGHPHRKGGKPLKQTPTSEKRKSGGTKLTARQRVLVARRHRPSTKELPNYHRRPRSSPLINHPSLSGAATWQIRRRRRDRSHHPRPGLWARYREGESGACRRNRKTQRCAQRGDVLERLAWRSPPPPVGARGGARVIGGYRTPEVYRARHPRTRRKRAQGQTAGGGLVS